MDREDPERRRPSGVTALAVIHTIAAVLTFVFWVLVYLRLFTGGRPEDPALRSAYASTMGFLAGDVLYAVPLLAAAAAGLWRMREWGLLIAQMVNIMWIYSMTVIWVRDIYAGSVSPGAVLFTPFAAVSAWAVFYLWRERRAFGER